MFRIDQIVSVSTFIRNFREIAQRLRLRHEPLLLTQRDGGYIVVMDGAFFEDIMDARKRIQSMPEDL
ncbi:MAG: hypothetical protein RL518_1091 [Pseudomonadota bacterium]|jgi:PHD/YefM family antitoxin component YafN of YafNO toxin-antitoxin module